ncbi:MAG: DNA repair protein RadC [Chloroflexota bacterium]
MKNIQLCLIKDVEMGQYAYPKVNQLPIREQPGYRVAHNPEACSLAELLAVIIGGSTQIEIAEELLKEFGSIQQIMRAHVEEIKRVPGISRTTAVRLKAALTLGRKILQPEEIKPIIQSPADAAQILLPIVAHREQEFLFVLPLSTRNHVLDVVEVYHGTLNASMVRIAEVFKPAMQLNAAAIIFAHNHPSGDPEPSGEDIELTRAVIQGGKLLDFDVLDHLILGHSRWISLKERRLGFGG